MSMIGQRSVAADGDRTSRAASSDLPSGGKGLPGGSEGQRGAV